MGFFSMPLVSGNVVCAKNDDRQLASKIEKLRQALDDADAVIVGAGAGMSTAAGLTYSGERFDEHFADFRDAFGITDMYSGGFYPFPDVETLWAWWSRHIYFNRYDVEPGRPYLDLLKLVKDKDYFVITTNVDHQFQLAGFDKHRLFYTQGDYGLFQCSGPCSQVTYDNEEAVRAMMEQQKGMRIPSELVPTCPKCGRPMTTNLRVDGRFVEDEGWHMAAVRYDEFCRRHAGMHVLYLELGVGMNTPVIIKYPFWNAVDKNPKAIYACVSLGEACAPKAANKRSILIDGDIGMVLSACVS